MMNISMRNRVVSTDSNTAALVFALADINEQLFQINRSINNLTEAVTNTGVYNIYNDESTNQVKEGIKNEILKDFGGGD